jgi:hypothetical protein
MELDIIVEIFGTLSLKIKDFDLDGSLCVSINANIPIFACGAARLQELK